MTDELCQCCGATGGWEREARLESEIEQEKRRADAFQAALVTVKTLIRLDYGGVRSLKLTITGEQASLIADKIVARLHAERAPENP